MKTTEKYVFFWNGPFSNWYPAEFKDPITDHQFKNSEQAFMWWKAKHFKSEFIASKILTESDPAAVKKYGRGISNYNDEEWSKVRYNYMVWVNTCKFSQNAELLTQLLDTGNKTLVEASPTDCVWGIKMAETDPVIEDETKWQGQNLLGKALMEVREKLRIKQ